MEPRQRIFLGCLGALTPVILNLLVVDLETTLMKATIITFLGYVLRVLVLCYAGGLVAFLYKDESNHLKIFQLGLAAPALITALINAGNVPKPAMPSANPPRAGISLMAEGVAYAQTPVPATGEIKTFSVLRPSAAEQFLQGLTGARPQNAWFVIAGSHRKLEDAEKQVQEIAKDKNLKEFQPAIYAPYGNNPYYAVVIGANMKYDEAQALRQEAVAAGLPSDTYLWTFPR